MAMRVVGDRLVNLVADDRQLVADHKFSNVAELGRAQHGSDRVPRRIEQQEPGRRRNCRLERLPGQTETAGGERRTDVTDAAAALGETTAQLIWPYTDLLLHDMGERLSDDRPSFDAQGSEWRTPPLWGIGRYREVNGHDRLLHDGRARGVAEAILWHGGEADASRAVFEAMSSDDRTALIAFVESL